MTPASDSVARVLRWLLAVRSRVLTPMSRRAQATLLMLAAGAFTIGLLVSWRSLELSLSEIRWPSIAVVFLVLTPATVLVNAWELRVSARACGTSIGRDRSVRVVILATAANFLPLPGAALVRARALAVEGARLGQVTMVTGGAALLWVGVSASVAATPLIFTGRAVSASLFFVGAVGAAVLGVGAVVQAGRAADVGSGPTMVLVAVQFVLVTIQVTRLAMVFHAIGAPQPAIAAVVLSVSAALAASAGVFPGGLGLAEGIAAALAPLVAVGPALAFTATAINRVIGMALIAPVAAAAGLADLRRGSDVPIRAGSHHPDDEVGDEADGDDLERHHREDDGVGRDPSALVEDVEEDLAERASEED